jgi:tetratricopeptide (TPR) repeat protein
MKTAKLNWLSNKCGAAILGLIIASTVPCHSYAFTPESDAVINLEDDGADKDKSADELIAEAQSLLSDERPLDARTKLLKALSKEPKNFKPHMLLGGYYMIHVGHFRLALSYLKQAEKLFEITNGKPPFEDFGLRDDHARILYLLAETKLNLDNYRGALTALDEYAKFYSGSWYPGSRAWVLMKLGRVQEATRIARLGILMGAEPGRTLNILGILLSMQNQRQESLRVFDEAITYEYSLGSSGQPATPLNNSGEVFREIFEEDRAEGSWLRAVGLPDGCEHVLPSLNLASLYIEQLRFDRANWAMNNFEECNRQFPLRNGEEHRALVHMARGRVSLHTGQIEEALKHLESATERQQWFGKIGTNPNDLRAATTLSLAQTLKAANHYLDLEIIESPWQWLEIQQQKIGNSIRAWWLMRRARQVLSEDLKDFEDIYVRSTDAMLEYHTLGDVMEAFPTRVLLERVNQRSASDSRNEATNYYYAYLAQNYLAHGETKQGLAMVDETLTNLRERADDGLKAHLLGLKLKNLQIESSEYSEAAVELFKLAPAEVINKGAKLPVRLSSLSQTATDLIKKGPFHEDEGSQYLITAREDDGKFTVSLTSNLNTELKEGSGQSLVEAYKDFLRVAFREKI